MNKLLLLILCGCFSPHIADGKLHCAGDRSCPEGFTCADDNLCWRHVPSADLAGVPDLATVPDLGHADLATVPRTAHRGLSAPAGAIQARSEHFQALMTAGEPPGGSAVAASSRYQLHAGAVGATQ